MSEQAQHTPRIALPPYSFEECEPGYLLDSTYIRGVLYHVEAIRVTTAKDGCLEAWEPSDGQENSNDGRLERLCHIDDGIFRTVQIPGVEGDWLVYMTPSCQ